MRLVHFIECVSRQKHKNAGSTHGTSLAEKKVAMQEQANRLSKVIREPLKGASGSGGWKGHEYKIKPWLLGCSSIQIHPKIIIPS